VRSSIQLKAALAAGAVFIVGCDFSPPADSKARLAQLEQEGIALNAAADQLETRLLDGQARVREWDELARRHQEVSALSCRVSQGHEEEMVRLMEYQDEKSRRKARGEQVVAQTRVHSALE
jgi:hypothetical protein